MFRYWKDRHKITWILREPQIDRYNEIDKDILTFFLDFLSFSIDLPYLLFPLLRGIRRAQCVFLGSNWIEVGWFTYTSRYMPWGRRTVRGFCIKRGAERHYSHCTHTHTHKYTNTSILGVHVCEWVQARVRVRRGVLFDQRNSCNAMPKFNSF